MLWGCASPEPSAPLLELGELSVEGDPDAGNYALSGEGLPAGRPGVVQLEGTLHRPGQRPRAVRASLTGRVASDGRLRFAVAHHPELSRLAPGQFEGTLTVSFEADEAEVTGRLGNIRLRLSASSAEARRKQLVAARRASEWLASLGVHELEVDAEQQGVRVGRVDEQAPAHAVGLRAGDRIVSVGGAPASELCDLWPAPGKAPVALRVERGAVDAPHVLRLPRSALGTVQAPPDPRWARAGGVWLVALGLLWPLRQVPSTTPRLRVAWRSRAAALVVGALPVLAMGGDELHVSRGLAVTVVLLLVAGGFLAREKRGVLWVHFAARLSLAALAIASAGLLVGTLSPSLSGASSSPLAWRLFGAPPGWLALALTYAGLRADALPVALRPFMTAARFVCVAALVALLGGAGSLGELWRGLPWLSWVLKSTLLWTALELVWPRRPSPPALLVGLAVATPAAVVAWSWLEPASVVPSTLAVWAPCALGACLVRACIVRARTRWAPAPEIDPGLVPFL